MYNLVCCNPIQAWITTEYLEWEIAQVTYDPSTA